MRECHSLQCEARSTKMSALQFGSELLAEFDGFLDWTFGFGAADRSVREGKHAQPELIIDHLSVGGDRTLTAAAHGGKEGAFSGDALERVEMIQPFANRSQSLITFTNFDADCALADARQHHLGIQ